jgi:multidrug resistance efflux pump
MIAITATALLSWPFGQELSGRARVEAIAERTITSPQDGFIQAVHVRPGDVVEESRLLVELSAQDLQLDAQRIGSEVVKHESAYMAALVRSDRAQMAMNLADLRDAQAQLALSKSRLSRSRIEAPVAGIVTDGDLTRSIGAPVKRGEVLLTIAPDQGRRVSVQIDEQDIRHVKPGQAASLALSALPWDSLPMTIVRVMPLARTIDGANVFEVEARPEHATASLRPGMTGVARISVGRESLGGYAARKIGNALRLCWWTFGF